jgi:uncharacterized RDD family membrane protein YckC
VSLVQLDTVYHVETPEGIDLQAQLAGPVARILAYAVDVSIRSVVLTIASIFLALADNAGVGITLILAFLLEWLYPVFFEVLRNGQTPGKKYLGLTVVNDDLTAIGLGSSVLRNLLRFADFLPFGYITGLVSMTVTKKFQRLGDLAAGSIVIYQTDQQHTSQLPECHSSPPPMVLALEDQTALINFIERHHELSPDRQQELADILQEVTHKRGKESIAYLRGIGAWLLGVK